MTSSTIEFQYSSESFKSAYFEKKPFLQRQAFHRDLITFNDLGDLLFPVDPAEPRIKVFRDGLLPKKDYIQSYQDGYSIANRFLSDKMQELLRTGASLVVDRFDMDSPIVSDLCRQLSKYIGARCVANAYIAYGGSGSFGKHWDTHCVFALQLSGRKHWLVYPPTVQNPLKFQRSSSADSGDLGEPVIDVVLEAGDLLYVPRGWWHAVNPIENQETVHIAVGVHTSRLHDYVSWICAEILPNVEELRETFDNTRGADAISESVLNLIKKEITNENNIATFSGKLKGLTTTRSVIDFKNISNSEQ